MKTVYEKAMAYVLNNAELINTVLMLYGWLWVAFAWLPAGKSGRQASGPFTWGITQLAHFGINTPDWAHRVLTEPKPPMAALALIMVVVGLALAEWARTLVFLFACEWHGLWSAYWHYTAAMLLAGAYFAVMAKVAQLGDKSKVRDPKVVFTEFALEPVLFFLYAWLWMFSLIDKSITNQAGRNVLAKWGKEDEVRRSLKSMAVSEMTALDFAHALWLAQKSGYTPKVDKTPVSRRKPLFGED